MEHILWVIDTTASQGDDDTLIRDIYDVVDPRVTCHSYLSWNLWMIGQQEQAIAESDRAIALAERLKHPFSIALALSFAIWLKQFCGRTDRVRELAERSIAHCRQHGFAFWIGWDQVLLGWADSHQAGSSIECVELMHKGLAYWKEKGSNLGCGYFYCLVADVHLRFGEWSAALDALAQAQTFMQETGEHYYRAERHRLHGQVMAGLHPGTDAAERSFQRALEIATEQGARSHQLSAALSLAEIWRDAARHGEAMTLLQDTMESWDRTDNHPQLETAQALLASLQSSSDA